MFQNSLKVLNPSIGLHIVIFSNSSIVDFIMLVSGLPYNLKHCDFTDFYHDLKSGVWLQSWICQAFSEPLIVIFFQIFSIFPLGLSTLYFSESQIVDFQKKKMNPLSRKWWFFMSKPFIVFFFLFWRPSQALNLERPVALQVFQLLLLKRIFRRILKGESLLQRFQSWLFQGFQSRIFRSWLL